MALFYWLYSVNLAITSSIVATAVPSLPTTIPAT
ncbi:MAG: hypothetical protein ACI9XU_000832, partial [Arenicella sp.]